MLNKKNKDKGKSLFVVSLFFAGATAVAYSFYKKHKNTVVIRESDLSDHDLTDELIYITQRDVNQNDDKIQDDVKSKDKEQTLQNDIKVSEAQKDVHEAEVIHPDEFSNKETRE